MKKNILISCILYIQIGIITAQQKAYIPDDGFRNFLISEFSSFMKGDSLLIDSAATFDSYLNCSGIRDIHDISGIEYFENIIWLNCNGDSIFKPIDLSTNNKLIYLDCAFNKLETLPKFSKNSIIKQINASYNNIKSLSDADSIETLEELNVCWNKLTFLPPLLGDTSLKKLNVSNNYLLTLPDLSHLTNIVSFNCQNNYLDFSVSNEYEIIYTQPKIEEILFLPQYAKDIRDSVTFKCPGDTFVISFPKQGSEYEYEWHLDDQISKIDITTDPNLLINGFSLPAGDSINIYKCNSVGSIWEKASKWNTSISTARFPIGTIKVIAKKTELVNFSGLDTAYCLVNKNYQLNGSPEGGIFYGQGINDNFFNPYLAGIGEHSIKYIYNQTSGCNTSVSKYVKVKECTQNTDLANENNNYQNLFEVFPNPSIDKLNIALKNIPNCQIKIEIYSITGSLLYQNSELVINNNLNKTIEIKNLSDGIYVLNLVVLTSNFHKKFIIKR